MEALPVSPAARATLSRLVCGRIPAERITPSGSRATVLCRPHAQVGGHAESWTATCARASARWDCEPRQRALHRQVDQRRYVLTRDTAVTPGTATDVVRFAGKTYDHTFNGRDLTSMITGACHVAHAGAPFDGAESFEISCGPERLTVTRDCWQGRCRLYPAALGPRGQ